MEKHKTSLTLSILLLSVTSFFYSIIGNGYILLIASAVPIAFLLLKSMHFDKEDLAWMSFLLVAFISANFSYSQDSTWKFILVIGISFVFKLVFEKQDGWQDLLMKLFFGFSAIHVAATLINLIAPDAFLDLLSKLYTAEAYETCLQLINYNSYPGIAGHTSSNAFFISIFIAFSLCHILTDKKKSFYIICLVLGMIALFLTQKRSFLITNVAAFMLILMLGGKENGKFLKKFFIILFVAAAIYFVLTFIPETNHFIEKFIIYSESGNFTNGRTELWKHSIDVWKKNIIFGAGAGSLTNSYGISSHNVYIQLLAETGIVGLLCYLAIVITSLKLTLNLYKTVLTDNELSDKQKSNYSISLYMQLIYIMYCFAGNPVYNISMILSYAMFIAVFKSYGMSNILKEREIDNEGRNYNLP